MVRGDSPPRHVRAQRLRLTLFGLLYGPAARFYDRFVAWLFLGEWEHWQRTAIDLLPATGLVVELGAGTGALAAIGARPGRPWIGIEPSPAMLAVARSRLRDAGPFFVRAHAQLLPIPTGTVSAVVATFPTPYVSDPATVGEIRRVLGPNGTVIIVLTGTLAADGLRRRLRRFALACFYGRRHDGPSTQFALAGFAGSLHTVRTLHGVVLLYVGKPEYPLTAGERDRL